MGLQSPRIDFLGPTHAWVWPEREFPKNVSGRKEQAMSFVNKVDKIEKMEQKFWPLVFKRAEKRVEKLKNSLHPKNYKGGVLGQLACLFLGLVWLGVFLLWAFLENADNVAEIIYDPAFSEWEENIFHE